MNKFLLLIRRYLYSSFRFISRNDWHDAATITAYLDILRATPLNPSEPRIPNGLRYHVIDIYVDELDRVDEKREGKMPLEVLLEPLRTLGKESPTKPVRERVNETLEDERLQNWNETAQGESHVEGRDAPKAANSHAGNGEVDEEEEWGGIEE
jgi:ribosomal RNA-processing protein 1